MIRILFLLTATAVLASSCSHRYYIVRHAEKDSPSGNSNMMTSDPALSEAGKVRALVLRDQLKNKHVRYIFSTNTKRTISTAAPLSEATGVKIEFYDSKDSLSQFLTRLKTIRKGTAVIIGHSNTVDDIVNGLCNAKKIPGDLPDSQYDNIFIVTYRGKKIKFTRHKYGYPSNPE